VQRQEALVKAACAKSSTLPEWATASEFTNLNALQAGLRTAGLESSSLIVAVDFTKSNKTQGQKSFDGQCLHTISKKRSNPYESVLRIMDRALGSFDDDNKIPALYFGSSDTRHLSAKSFRNTGACEGMEDVLKEYRRLAQCLDFSGPTSFAPVIDTAVEMVQAAGNTFHILVIVADGQVTAQLDCLKQTRDALIRASRHPLAVVIVGVGDGPFSEMDSLDDDLPERVFDNTQFVTWAPFQQALDRGEKPDVVEAAFAVCALQEVPQQYRTVANLGLLESAGGATRVSGKRMLEITDGDQPTKRHCAVMISHDTVPPASALA